MKRIGVKYIKYSLAAVLAVLGVFFLRSKNGLDKIYFPLPAGYCSIEKSVLLKRVANKLIADDRDGFGFFGAAILCSELSLTSTPGSILVYRKDPVKFAEDITRAKFLRLTLEPVAKILNQGSTEVVYDDKVVPKSFNVTVPNLQANSLGIDEFASYQGSEVEVVEFPRVKSYWSMVATTIIHQHQFKITLVGETKDLSTLKQAAQLLVNAEE